MRKNKIILFENNFKGHRKEYFNSLIGLKCTEMIMKLDNNLQNKLLKNLFQIILLFNLLIKYKNKIHVLDLDSNYFPVFISTLFFNQRIIATLHHYPSKQYQVKMLNRIVPRVKLVVHSDEIFNILNSRNVSVIYYPSFLQSGVFQKNRNEYRTFLIIGSTNYYKDYSLLIRSISMIDEQKMRKIKIVIAGKETDFEYEILNNELGKMGVHYELINNFLSEDEYLNRIVDCDYILLPYKKEFEGASGPLVDGVSQNKIIIGPNHGTLGSLIKKYDLGFVYETGNENSLKDTIISAIDTKFEKSIKYYSFKEKTNFNTFQKMYSELYIENI